MKKAAVVILNYNGKELLKKFLPSFIQNTDSQLADIYVADNASTDHSVAFIQEHFPQVKIIQIPENLGYAGGYNYALQKIDNEIFVLVNSDIEVTGKWLNYLIDTLEQEDSIAAVQPKLLDFNHKNKFEYAGGAGGFIDRYGYPFCRGRIFDTIEEDYGQYNDTADIFWASGACFAIKKQYFTEVGGFDELFFAHMEEIDLCWRLFHKGYRIKFDYRSVVYHVGGHTLSVDNPFKTYLNFRNSLYLLYKNLPNQRFRIIFIRLLLDGIAGCYFLFQGKWKFTIAVIKAHGHFYSRFHKLKRTLPVRKDKYYYVESILSEYLLKKKKTFKELS